MSPVPERFRGDPALGAIGIRVDHGGGQLSLDPNRLIMASFDESLASLAPVAGVTSVISGVPSLRFTTDEVSVGLTGDEIRRLALRNLSPAQYSALRDAVGEIFEINPEFYDRANGYAMQPKEDHDELPEEIRKINFGPGI